MGPMTAQDSQTTEQHTRRAWMIPGAMLLVTGCCALVYQVCWLRGLRLVFGASTAANAAVLAIFMGGLGLGALRLTCAAHRGRGSHRADRKQVLHGPHPRSSTLHML